MAYTDIASVSAYLDIEQSGGNYTDDDTLLTAIIARAQKFIETYTGRLFECATATDRYFNVAKDVSGRKLYFDKDTCDITKVYISNDTTAHELTSGEYFTMPVNDAPFYGVEIAPSCGHYWQYATNPNKAAKITAFWAYSKTPPVDIVHATIRLAAYFYKQREAQVFDVTAMPDAGIITIPKGIPQDVKIILDHYRRVRL